MKNTLFFIFCYFCFTAHSQHVEWTKEIPTGIYKAHFIDNRLCIVGPTYGIVEIDSVVYSLNNPQNSFFASIKKNGAVDTVFNLSNFIPIDFIKADSAYYINGWGPFRFCMSKSTQNGNISWSNCYDSYPPYGQQSPYYPFNEALSVVEHKHSIYVIGNYEDSLLFGSQWMYGGVSLLAKVNSLSGNINWVKNIPSAKKIINLNDGTFLIGSNSYPNTFYDTIAVQLSNKGIVVSRIDTTGNFMTAKVIVEGASIVDMVVDVNNSIYITGEFDDSCRIGSMPYVGKKGGFFLVKTDSVGNALWSKTFFSSRPGFGGYPFSIAVSPNNSVYLSGGFYSDSLDLIDTLLTGPQTSWSSFLAKFSPTGGFDFAMTVNSTGGCSTNEVTVDENGAAYWWGSFMGTMQIENKVYQSPLFNYSYYLLKISGNEAVGVVAKESSKFTLYPNPTSGILTVNLNKSLDVTLILYDVLGNCLSKKDFRGQSILHADLSLQSKGVYFMEIVSDGERVVKKIVLQ